MTPRQFWMAAIGVLAGLVVGAWLVAPEQHLVPVAWTLVATFVGACVGAALLLALRGNSMSMMASTLGRSVVSVLGVVLIWLLLEPEAKPVLGAFVIGYFVFLGLETALAFGLTRSGDP